MKINIEVTAIYNIINYFCMFQNLVSVNNSIINLVDVKLGKQKVQ